MSSRARTGIAIAAAAGCAGAAVAWALGGLRTEGILAFGTFVTTATLWVSGAVPPWAAGALAVAVTAALLPTVGWSEIARQSISPAVAMTAAGMLLALGAARTGVDRAIAERLLGPVLGRPVPLLLTVMATGAVLSMFMSNTATAVLLLAIVVPVVAPLGTGSPSARAIVLAAALGAAVGGIATPIGTSPNVVAYGLIRDAGHGLGFARWTLIGLPVAAAALACGVLVLRALAKDFGDWSTPAGRPEAVRIGPGGWAWIAVFGATVALWSTEPWSGIPIGRASLVPIVALPALGLVRGAELRRIDWRTLVLLFAGLVLGMAMGKTGVARWIVDGAIPADASPTPVIAAFCAISVTLSTFMSNTATANLVVPMALAIADPGVAVPCAVAAAMGASLAVGLPVSTPPMLLAFGTGFVRSRELAVLGIALAALGTVAVTIAVSAG